MKIKILFIISIIIFVVTSDIKSQFSDNIRNNSLGRTSVSNSFGIDALNQNPALILKKDINDSNKTYISGLFNFGFVLNSDFASYNFYNNYFTGDEFGNSKYLNEKEKSDIYDLASDGVISMNSSLKIFSIVTPFMWNSTLGISLEDRGSVKSLIPRQGLELSLWGNEIGKRYDFSEGYVSSYWLRQLNISLAKEINISKSKKISKLIKNLYAGFSIKPQFGYYYFAVKENNLSVSTDIDRKITGTGRVLINAVQPESILSPVPRGVGVGIDFGIYAKINDHISAGLSIVDLGFVNWFSETYEYRYNGSFVITDITQKAQLDSLTNLVKGTKTKIPSFNSYLPLTLRFGASYKIFRRMSQENEAENPIPGKEFINLSLDYIQGLNEVPGTTLKPIVAFGAEFYFLNFLIPRIGVIAGGYERFTVSAGFGFKTKLLDIDIGTHNIFTAFSPYDSRKISGGISIKWKFGTIKRID